MTYGAFTSHEFAPFPVLRPRVTHRRMAACTIGVLLSLTAGFGLLGVRTEGPWDAPRRELPAPAGEAAILTPVPSPIIAPALPPLRRYAGLLAPDFVSGTAPMTFARSAPLRAGFEVAPVHDAARGQDATDAAAGGENTPDNTIPVRNTADASMPGAAARAPDVSPIPVLPAVPALVANIPVPAPRPALLAAAARAAQPSAPGQPPQAVPADGRTILQKLFGTAEPQPAALAYAPVDGGTVTRPGGYDRWTAVYDIAAHTVYLPNGTRLEAHSGLGSRLDDPRGVTERMRGATPPNLYELTLREATFHGVRALRLTPTGGTTFGRGGLLAHTFMLGPRGDSNGCVVFRDYQAFLRAFDSGDVKHLAVVARLN